MDQNNQQREEEYGVEEPHQPSKQQTSTDYAELNAQFLKDYSKMSTPDLRCLAAMRQGMLKA